MKATHKTTMRLFMQSAWNLARSGAARFGGTSREYIQIAMRLVWQDWKKAPESVYCPGIGTRMWLPGVERKTGSRRGQYVLPGIAL